MAADETTRRLASTLAEHLAECCMTTLSQQNFPVPHGGVIHERLIELFDDALQLEQTVHETRPVRAV